tara:strand:+ start:27172 stop:27684 length:513 start_codon:yes stop_codon:yes gene_type:complete
MVQLSSGILGFAMVLVVFPVVGVAEAVEDKATTQDRKRIEGTWTVAALTTNGGKAKKQDLEKLRVINDGDGNWTLLSEDKMISKGTSTLDPRKKPKAIDFTVTEGEGTGKQYRGIYKIGKKNRRMCFAPSEQDRPNEFRSKPGSNHILVVYERLASAANETPKDISASEQ